MILQILREVVVQKLFQKWKYNVTCTCRISIGKIVLVLFDGRPTDKIPDNSF